jgi:hypothetical protein
LIAQNSIHDVVTPEPNPSYQDEIDGNSASRPQSELNAELNREEEAIPVNDLLCTLDDVTIEMRPPVTAIVARLIKEAKQHKSFSALFKLEAVKKYIELYHKYAQNPRVNNPRTQASDKVATAVGKGKYFSRKIRHLAIYIKKFHTLPPTSAGKHHAHPSLLNNELVAHAVRRYLTVTAAGEVS